MVSLTTTKSLALNEYQRVIFPVSETVVGSVQAILTQGSWGSTVLTLKRSNDGQRFVAWDPSTTLTSETMTAALTTTGWAWLAVEVTTLAGATAYADIVVHAKSET